MDALRTQLCAQYPGLVTVINSGEAGMWSQWGVEHLPERVLAHRPDMVFLEFAINDAFLPYNTTITQCKERLNFMIYQILEANRSCDIVVITTNPPVGEHLSRRPQIEQYYEAYREVAKHRKLPLADHHKVWKAMLEQEKELFDQWVPDGVHPSKEADENITAAEMAKLLFAAGSAE